jgi:hypothetical protein
MQSRLDKSKQKEATIRRLPGVAAVVDERAAEHLAEVAPGHRLAENAVDLLSALGFGRVGDKDGRCGASVKGGSGRPVSW